MMRLYIANYLLSNRDNGRFVGGQNLLYIVAVGILFLLYIWSFYNIPILAAGAKYTRNENRKNRGTMALSEKLPSISIIVPVKDEEKLVRRLLEALFRLDYPAEKFEIIIVEDGSVDNTVEICKEFCRRYPGRVRLVCRPASNGKPSALNYGLKHVRSELAAVFDADSVPESNALLNAVRYFEEPSVVAVQGRTHSINVNQSLLTKFVSYEEAIAFETYLLGKDALNLFVPLTGTCYFIRKCAIDEVGGWDDNSLSEDVEMSIKLTSKGYKIKYAPDVWCWQESSSNVAQLIRQRIRWFRGGMELALKYGKLTAKLDRKNVDIEFTLAGPYVFPLCFLGFMIVIYGFFVPVQLDTVFGVIAHVTSLLTIILLLVTGAALVYVTKQRKTADLKWLPFIYAYWIIETFVATYALIQIALRRPRKWTKTEKTGIVASSAFETGS